MMYYIDSPNTWRAANRKCAELQDYVSRFKNCLIQDALSRDALIMEIRRKVAELNDLYPRTKRLSLDSDGNFISCFPQGRGAEYEYVFTMRLLPVRRTYRFAERVDERVDEQVDERFSELAKALKEGGTQ